MKGPWPIVRLAEILTQRKEFIVIDDLQAYKRARVQLHAQGIVLRDELPGAMIKTKKQQLCRAGEFLVAEIDAKVGGFGIIPSELEGAIVSSHYFLFGAKDDRLDRRFLGWFIKTRAFRQQVAAQGSTNYAAIRPADVLGYQIPLPPLAEQLWIVTRIEELAGKIAEARSLRHQSIEEAGAVVTSMHVSLAGERTRSLSDLLMLDEDAVQVTPTEQYPQVGIRSFGGGLFSKQAVQGIDTTYKTFNRLYRGALVLSQVKGWEGAVAVCDANLEGWFVSPEYRTFRCVSSEARPGYLAAVIRTEWFWSKLQHATRGVGARRERTRPEQFLAIEIPMPDVHQQENAEAVFKRLDALRGCR